MTRKILALAHRDSYLNICEVLVAIVATIMLLTIPAHWWTIRLLPPVRRCLRCVELSKRSLDSG